MGEENQKVDRRSLVRQAIRTIDDLHARLEAARGALRAPIAIVGIGCRYPGGVTGPDSFWELLCAGTDAITEVPADRWDLSAWYDADGKSPGKMSTRFGGFLDGIDQFDAPFFGISPREAAMLDPQHRILLEVAWEALEHAGQPFDKLAGSQTGVFVGITTSDYYQHLLRELEPAALSPYLTTGTVLNAAAGRLAFFLGTHGPSMAVDTACSSSLTAIHLACQSLRTGDCQMALAGGVNVILLPEPGVMFSNWGMMAPDGRCKTFDSSADGFVRSEGCGIVVLKRLSDALTSGDRILAVIEGSAINQDGRSSGLTVPNGVAQAALIRQALTNAGVKPNQVGYVEAHGTGTLLGDPIEVEALNTVFGPGRGADQKLRIGSVKTNLGHTESASGVAGLIKCVLALEHEQLPPQLHLRQPTPQVDWDTMPIEVVTQAIPWPRGVATRRAGVSSFGVSGANAHVVVAEAPALPPVTDQLHRPRHILAFSARDPQALGQIADRYAVALREQAATPLTDFCFTANSGRAHHRYRAALSGRTHEEMGAALSRFADADESTLSRGQWSGEPVKVAFLFTGQGSQYVGMGRQLYDGQPIFRAELDRCADLLASQLDRPLLDVMFAPAERSAELDQTCYTQPALFALEWSLAQMWRSWGVEPAALLGHSVGEYVAACQAGVMSLEDGLRLIAERARLMQSLPPDGMMVAIAADESTVRQLLLEHGATASIAAVNGPRNVVISGRSDTVQIILDKLRVRQISAMPLAVSHAFHSPLMEPILEPLERIAAQVHYGRPRIPIVSNLTGAFAKQDELASAAYWKQHARSPVRFADGIQELHRKGCTLFLEIGPAPVLINMGRQCLDPSGQKWLPSLVRGRDDWSEILRSLAELYVRGVPVDWTGFDRGYTRRRVALPTYPFQRKRFWVDSSPKSTGETRSQSMLRRTPGSPLVKEIIYSGELGPSEQPWLSDHVVAGRVVVPMTAFVEMALAAAIEVLQTKSVTIEDLVIREKLVLEDGQSTKVQLVLNPAKGVDEWELRIISLGRLEPEGWLLHASGRLRRWLDVPSNVMRKNFSDTTPLDADAHYQKLAARGFDFGPAFRGVMKVMHDSGKCVGEISPPELGEGVGNHCVFHPALLDACLQPLVHVWPEQSLDAVFLPFAVERINIQHAPTTPLTSYCEIRDSADRREDTIIGDVTVCDEMGQVVAAFHGLTMRRSEHSAVPEHVNEALYEIQWRPAPEVSPAQEGSKNMPSVPAVASIAMENRGNYLAHAAAEGYAQAARLLHARSLKYMATALQSLGWKADTADSVSLRSLVRQLGVQPRYERLLGRLVQLLNADREAGNPAATNPVVTDDVKNRFAGEFRLLDDCGSRLADVLRGECDPLELLFGPAASVSLETVYSESVTAQAINQFAADVFRGIVDYFPTSRKLRVLEIGAGTGGTTSHVLSQLPPDRTEYCFTDISPTLIRRARLRFAKYPFMQFAVLDIERELRPQGFGNRQFDVVLAANVVHATADLRETLIRVRRLLVPGGLLVLTEGTRAQSWVDLTFGLTDGWWKFTDTPLRPDYPLLPAATWLKLLKEQGFSAPLQLGGPAADGQPPDYSVFLAGGSAEVSRAATTRNPWLIFIDEQDTGDAVAAELKLAGHACVTVRPAAGFEIYAVDAFGLHPTCRADYDRLLEELKRSGRRCGGVAHLWSLNAKLNETGSAVQLADAQDWSCRSLLYLAQSLAMSGETLESGLWAITRGGQAVLEDVHRVAAAQATVWGLCKVLALEHPELRVARLDLDPATAPDADEAKRIAEILLQPIEEAQGALRGGRRYVPRLVRKKSEVPTDLLRLVAKETGQLDSLTWERSGRTPPGPGQVEVRVAAAGLNFRDVLSALGMYPGDAGPLGGEVAGTIVAVGPGVDDLAVGDAVGALASGGFSDYVVTAADLTIKKPADWTFAEIATVSAAFSTAYHALVQLGRIRRGQTVFIHAAAGGVGLAAVQLAKQTGCRIIATAGSPAKRDYLRSIGVEHVFDSRSLTFADGVRSVLTSGDGVDLILNSLSGEFIEASLALLSPRGCFVELGKRGIWDAARVASIRPEATYHIVDLAARAHQSPADFRPILAAASAAIAAGIFRPLPVQIFPRDQVLDAFRHMAQAKHIGKIVVSLNSDGVPISGGRFSANPEATYLITGGLTGLGLRTAQWLADRGARHLTIMARRLPSDEANQALNALRDAGVEVMLAQGDVAQALDVGRVLEAIRVGLPPLRGVIHAAGVLDDGAILQQNWSRFEHVLSPKMAGAWNLHVETRHMPLDLFVCYSSATAILGARGQANHAAANAFMDALAHHRRGLGLPGLSINWGPWSDIGAAALRDVFDRVADSGVAAIDPEQGIAALERLLFDGTTQAAVIPMDWARFASTERPAAECRFFADVLAAPAAKKTSRPSDKPASIEPQLKAAPPSKRRKLIQSTVRDAMIGILELDPESQIDPLQSFGDLGFDSLMSIELRSRLQTTMGRALPATLAFDYPSLGALVDHFCREWGDPSLQTQMPATQTEGRELEYVTELAELSPADTEALLAQELVRTRELLS